jgi:hypothetical protein
MVVQVQVSHLQGGVGGNPISDLDTAFSAADLLRVLPFEARTDFGQTRGGLPLRMDFRVQASHPQGVGDLTGGLDAALGATDLLRVL